MTEKIVAFADKNRAFVLLLVFAVLAGGIWGTRRLPIDAVPDVTNVQVQIVSQAPSLAPAEVERYVIVPIERALSGTPHLREVRSISRAGLGVVTAVFDEAQDVYSARTLVNERIQSLRRELPDGARVDLGPISTGLGEIFQFVVRGDGKSSAELRTILEWEIAPRLRNVPGVVEVLAFGGLAQQYEVRLDPQSLIAHHVSIAEVDRALEANNVNAGGGIIERRGEQVLLRGEAQLRSIEDIGNVVVSTDRDGTAILVRHLGDIRLGTKLRTGAVTRNGEGEAVGGSVLMLLGSNSRDVAHSVATRATELNRELPNGVRIEPYYDRSELIGRTVSTVGKNLIEGAILVLIVLITCLGSWRAGLLVAAAIPFALSFAVIGMRILGVGGNLMSLGAIDFGIVVDGAVVIVERMLHAIEHGEARHQDGPQQRRTMMLDAARGASRGIAFSVGIILLVYVPLATLEDVEGKMFRPMVTTMVLALAGALLYALLVVPSLGPWILRSDPARTPRWMSAVERGAGRIARMAVNRPFSMLSVALAAVVLTGPIAMNLGAEFMPRLDEGALALDIRRPPRVSLTQATLVQGEIERIVRGVPEVSQVVSRTGRPEGGTDPSGAEASDCFIFLKDRSVWRPGVTRESLVADINRRLAVVPGIQIGFSQPIEMRVSDLIAGVKSDVAVKIFGDDLTTMREMAQRVARVLARVPGAADTKVEITTGMPTLRAHVRRDRLAALGVEAQSVLSAIEAARLGHTVGSIYDNARRFDLVSRLNLPENLSAADLLDIPIATRAGSMVPLGEVAEVVEETGDVQISRDNFRRRVVVETNVRGRDLVSFVAEARTAVEREVQRPPGVSIEWGGQFANFERAKGRLLQVVPVALGIIGLMLLFLFGSISRAFVAFLNVPLALAGGIVALWLRDLPFSIPAGVGLIASSGLAVLSGTLLIQALREHEGSDIRTNIVSATRAAARPIATAALIAAIGFIPMAIASSAGAEVQRPLATVVIGGVLSSAFLSLIYMPAALIVGTRMRELFAARAIRKQAKIAANSDAP